MLRLHSEHLAIPPESSQTRRPAEEGTLLPFSVSRATSTHSRGMSESGTRTATHSALGRCTCWPFFLKVRSPLDPTSETWVRLVRRRLNHHMPYLLFGSRAAATAADIWPVSTIAIISSRV